MVSISFALLGALVGGLIGLGLSYSTIKEIMRIYRTPTDPISALPLGGQVEVSGTAQSEFDDVRSPVTQTVCVLWRTEILEHHHSGRSGYDEQIFLDTSSHPFEVDDGTGQIKVFPSDADLILSDDLDRGSGMWDPLDTETAAALERMGISTTNDMGYKRYLKVHEHYVKSGEPIYVLGELKDQSGNRTITSDQDAPLIISDHSQQGTLDALYWRLARAVFGSAVPGALILFVLSNPRSR